jgi:hypothetical protein
MMVSIGKLDVELLASLGDLPTPPYGHPSQEGISDRESMQTFCPPILI